MAWMGQKYKRDLQEGLCSMQGWQCCPNWSMLGCLGKTWSLYISPISEACWNAALWSGIQLWAKTDSYRMSAIPYTQRKLNDYVRKQNNKWFIIYQWYNVYCKDNLWMIIMYNDWSKLVRTEFMIKLSTEYQNAFTELIRHP